MKPTLFVLAAGMGSRYGGLKQLDGLGPNGETIMDYSIYDALRAGFGKLVFVIRKHFEDDFRRVIVAKYENHIPVEIVFQELDKLPDGFTVPEGREKPWGTNHAVMMGRDAIREPFAAINADDFYGRHSFAVLGEFLRGAEADGAASSYAMVGYRVGNTLSESGTVARGICQTDAEGYLTGVVERTDVRQTDVGICFTDENGLRVTVPENTPVSMNMWGFTPDYFRHSEDYFPRFLLANMGNLKCEYFIPLMVNELITSGKATVKVLDTASRWFGITYAADRPEVVAKIRALVDAGEYPEQLF
ncbi:MAG: nucleotidyltransferase [Tannerellaceae bacterium]|jgi:choline kinase|nr:nucleotidyltransferase [Tannerellaceae bacterium]